jgi:hypothetical protein
MASKYLMILSLTALAFIGAFLLSLVLPALFLPASATSPLSLAIGVRSVRVILFVAASVCLFGVSPYVIYNFYKVLRLEAATDHFIRSRIQILMIDIEIASMTTKDTDALKALSHAFQVCKETAEKLPTEIDRAAAKFVAPTPPNNS